MGSRLGRGCLLAALLLFVSTAFAQTATTNPEDEYKKLVKVDTEIQPLGETPFGESVNLFDGALSFHVVDISIPGTGPTIEIGRTFHADGDAAVRWSDSEFGDWDLDLPRLTTLTSAQGTIIQGPNQIGWLVNSIARTDRCTNFLEPPDQRIGRPGSDPLPADAWWNQGYTLQIPGMADQDMLFRVDTSPAAPSVGGLHYVAVSKDRWHLGCLASTANGLAGEAFLAVGPNGQKYWLNYLMYKPARDFGIVRDLGVMAATRMEDRFGNSLVYNWSGDRLSSIVASDGRNVTFEYAADGKHISRINVVTANNGTRSWTYGYTAVDGGSLLSSVTLPNGTAWAYNLSALTLDVKSATLSGHCNDVDAPPDSTQVGTITGPSGLQGRFEAHPTRHARSNVPESCSAPTPESQGSQGRPRYSNNLALTSKTFTGAGISYTWTYQYPLAAASWQATCQASGCATTSVSLMVDPSFNTTRYTFSNQADATEGKPLKTEYFQGNTSGALLRTEDFIYALPSQGPWPARYGGGFNIMANSERQESEAPQSVRKVTQDGDTYTWQALAFDGYARPSPTRRSSSLGYVVDEKQEYVDDTARSILGLPTVQTNLTKNEVVGETIYDPATLTPRLRKHFGQTVMSYTFNAQGQLATFQDANFNTTRLDEYKLGVPRVITFPDINALHPNGTVERIAVDDFGQISSITDQAGSTTSYLYDAIGRVLRIDYPAGDSPSLAPRLFSYAYIGDARGVGGNHWVREVSQGNRYERTDFDAMLRPVVAGKSEAGTGALFVSSRSDFDWKGRKTFASYAVDGDVGRAAMSVGITTTYDALGRARAESQPSAQGTLVTATDYLGGGVTRVTDPKGHAVYTAFQAFDEPSYDKPVRVDAGVGASAVTQIIDRDLYGNPNAITQGGLTKTYTYDSQHRVCRSYEKETGSEISAFDAVGNVIWSASGQAFNGAGCGYDQVDANDKVTRAYDSMNRATQVAYPGVGPTLTYTYDLLGNPATAVSNTASGKASNAGVVGWAFGRNKMGVVTAELLSVDSWSWTVGYTYDVNGNLVSTQYPDGKSVLYHPNALGQPTGAGAYATGATYFPDGQVKSYALGNGALYAAGRNERNLLSDFTYGTAGNLAVSETYLYDQAGNITDMHDLVGSGQRSRTFTYDELNRLTGATSPGLWGNETYAYDALNNIQTVTNSGGRNDYGYNALNQLAAISVNGVTTHSYAYDNRGNVTVRDGQPLTFDVANRVLSIGTLGDYMYDAAGRRVKAASPTGNTYYAYNGAGQLLWQYDPATNAVTDYIYLGKKLVASTINVPAPALAPSISVPASAQANVAYTVSWTAVASSTGYELQEQQAGSAWSTVASTAALDRQLTHTAATFQYRVRGCNAAGCGPWSAQGTTVVAPPPNAPAAPASISGSMAANLADVTVSWSSSPSATSYDVQQVANGGFWTDLYSGTGTSTSVVNPADGDYTYQARACTSLGCSTWTASATVHVAHIPRAPTSISVPGTSTGVLGISWPAATYATSYSLEQSTDNANYGAVYNGGSTNATIGVGSTGTYYYRVKGCNANGCGPYSPVGASSVTIVPSQAPNIAAPGNSSDGCYTVNWGGSAGMTSYVMQENTNGAGWVTIGNNGSGALGICGKTNGTYYYRVQGCNVAGCGPFSATAAVTVALLPAVPTGIRMTDTVVGRSERYTVFWNAMPYATRYELLRVQVNGTINAGAATSYLVESGPSPYELQYTYRLRACNDQGCSAWSGDFAG